MAERIRNAECGGKELLLHCLQFHQVDLIIGLINLCALLNESQTVISECPTIFVNLAVIWKLQRLFKRDVGVGALKNSSKAGS